MENKLTFLTYINRVMTQQNIPPELVLNADQTSCSYVSMGKMTMASWLTDKRNIILTSTISLLGHFLPMQFIYQGKARASQPAKWLQTSLQFHRIQDNNQMKQKCLC